MSMNGTTNRILAAVTGAIALIIIVVCLFAMSQTIVDQEWTVRSEAVAGNWNFTGWAGAQSLVGLSPFVWFAAILLVIVGGSFMLVQKMS